MREFPERPTFVLQAQAESRAHHPALEVLIFAALFFVCSMAQTMLLLPPTLFAVLRGDFLRTAMAGDVNGAVQAVYGLLKQPWYMLLNLAATAVTVVGVLIFCRLIERRSLKTLGLVRRGALREYICGWLIGGVMLTLSMLPGLAAGEIRLVRPSGGVPWGMIALFLLAYAVQGMSEELMCRGYFCVSLARRTKLQWAILISSLTFAVLHLSNSGITPLAFLNLTLYGIFAALWLIRRGSIWGIAAMHSAWNFVQGNIWGCQVSGLQMNSSVFSLEQTGARTLFSGGSFGLEGGLGVTLVLAAGIALLCVMKNNSRTNDIRINTNIKEVQL